MISPACSRLGVFNFATYFLKPSTQPAKKLRPASGKKIAPRTKTGHPFLWCMLCLTGMPNIYFGVYIYEVLVQNKTSFANTSFDVNKLLVSPMYVRM